MQRSEKPFMDLISSTTNAKFFKRARSHVAKLSRIEIEVGILESQIQELEKQIIKAPRRGIPKLDVRQARVRARL